MEEEGAARSRPDVRSSSTLSVRKVIVQDINDAGIKSTCSPSKQLIPTGFDEGAQRPSAALFRLCQDCLEVRTAAKRVELRTPGQRGRNEVPFDSWRA